MYKKRVWQCEFTGKSNLTYYEALESERSEKEQVEDKLPEELQKSVLVYIQFRKLHFNTTLNHAIHYLWTIETQRLDAVVDNAYKQFLKRYVETEILNYVGDDKKT